jgi:surfeit locus 1 family protein
MYKFIFRPIWLLLHVTVIATIVLMINLAFWQIGRYHEKVDFNATVKERISNPIVPVEQLLEAIESRSESPETVEWRTVLVTGEYIDNETVEAVNRAQDGLVNNKLLLINRGFISISKDVGPAPSGQVQIIGRVRAPEIRRRFRISDPAQGELLEVSNIDLERLNIQMPSELAPIYVEVLESKPPDSPELSRIAAPALSTGSHLSYTFQWFTFSVFVLVGWIIVIRRKIKTIKAIKTL